MSRTTAPIRDSVPAKPHRAVYRMHRYYARRPYTVFANLINHYTEEHDLVLDPFCGGGVTLVEGQALDRRVVGFDINPLAAFITEMELRQVDTTDLEQALSAAAEVVHRKCEPLFRTNCRACGQSARAAWFEHSAVATCQSCHSEFQILDAEKASVGRWHCPECHEAVRFSCDELTIFVCRHVHYQCEHCEADGVAEADEADRALCAQASAELADEERCGLVVPDARIPECNMERESALHKKGIRQFRQLFTDRHLLCLARSRASLAEFHSEGREWARFAFSSALRYTNRMVTRNESWRGNRPLEWAKPGYWLPPVHLEAHPGIEFERRAAAIVRGKKDHSRHLTPRKSVAVRDAADILEVKSGSYHVSPRSSTHIPLPDDSVDCIVTDPPYGSYVHYADLSNFWSAWLDHVPGLGSEINSREEAVIARKSFPGAKTTADYQRLLEACFRECARVLKPGRFMVMTFNNREPRAWVALIAAALRAGFWLPADGVIFQNGIAAYRHTAQSRRRGSVIGDFIFSFSLTPDKRTSQESQPSSLDEHFIEVVSGILSENGATDPNSLMTKFYLRVYPVIAGMVEGALDDPDRLDNIVAAVDGFDLFDSHRRHLLEQHFDYREGFWSLRSTDGQLVTVS